MSKVFCTMISSADDYTMRAVEEKFNYWIKHEIFVNDKQFRNNMTLSWEPTHVDNDPVIKWSVS